MTNGYQVSAYQDDTVRVIVSEAYAYKTRQLVYRVTISDRETGLEVGSVTRFTRDAAEDYAHACIDMASGESI